MTSATATATWQAVNARRSNAARRDAAAPRSADFISAMRLERNAATIGENVAAIHVSPARPNIRRTTRISRSMGLLDARRRVSGKLPPIASAPIHASPIARTNAARTSPAPSIATMRASEPRDAPSAS